MNSTSHTAADAREKLAQRVTSLRAEDPSFRSAFPLPGVVAAKSRPGLRLAQLVQLVMEGYADRPALAQRARAFVSDAASGRRILRLLPHFETISYRDLWSRARALAGEWHHERNALCPGDFVAILGFASVDYASLILASIHLGAVIVPLQTSAPAAQHAAILAETGACILAVGIDYLDLAVDAVLVGPAVPRRLVVFDHEGQDSAQREALDAARTRLADAGCPIVVETLGSLLERGAELPAAPLYLPAAHEDPLAWLFYTSGSTGTPKGAMFTQSLVIKTWHVELPVPAITLSFMPMSHLVGNGYMLMTLANGGTSYCAPKSDLSTLFEDLALARPTMASLVPRVCEMFYQEFLRRLQRRMSGGEEAESAESAVKREMREQLLGGRLLSVGCGSAALAPEIHAFMESMLEMHMPIGYSSTEIAGGTILVDGKVQRPLVLDYRLADVPELGYFGTDKPYPRGELLVKTSQFMGGYFKRPDLTAQKLDPEGFYRTGDVMAEIGPDQLVFVDRCNNVIKLSQGEFVPVARLEALYAQSPLIRQIYLYGTSERSFLLAVVVPTEEGCALRDAAEAGDAGMKSALLRSMQHIADQHGLSGYEVPREFLLETAAFSQANGLLSEVGKHLRPMLRARYGDRLETLYASLARNRVEELRELRDAGAGQPVLETVTRALRAMLGNASLDVCPDDSFADLGGDSLSALECSKLLEDIFGIEVPVGVIVNPAGNARSIADYITAERERGGARPTFARVHGADATRVQARDLELGKFIDARIVAGASALPDSEAAAATVLLTGATGYLGRFLALSWLERLAGTDGRLIVLVRASDAAEARRRVDAALQTDPALMGRFRGLAARHLEVLPGDLGTPGFGLDEGAWTRLAGTVDLIVHAGAHVNHRLPYRQLFATNVAGTAELVRLAITSRRKRMHYVSTLGVCALCTELIDEDGDIRQSVSACAIDDGYANGYNLGKWASEVLLRNAHDSCGVPVSVFRPGMILAHSRYAGQLNVPDMFTRLLFSVLVTGVAPATFYAQDLSGGRPRARYEGLGVDFLADAIVAVGSRDAAGFSTYNLASPHDDGISLDTVVDWLVDAGCRIERIPGYDEWLARFETAMHALPEQQRQRSMLALLGPYRHPQAAVPKSPLRTERFCAAARAAGLEVPQLSAGLIGKYVDDLRQFGML